MPSSPPAPWSRQDSTDAILLTFVETRLLDEAVVREVGEQLLRIANQEAGRTLILNLASVEYASSHMVAKFLTVHQRVHALGGKLILRDVRSRIYAALCMAHLDKVLDVRPLADDEPSSATDSGTTMPLE